ncbi:WhiB family transcriptional regulator [Rhodococcus rhodochrous]|uniref:WhiB family transcriptional regulator n=1 Tax=Rhodococcus rhodochrous TaxID=1829 RepID=UPI0009BE89FE|nr:WhiB family transcriptional regulator [Rhodococcus rhodochrous]
MNAPFHFTSISPTRSGATRWEWQSRADCRLVDPSVFYPPDDETRGVRLRRERIARQICTTCPVRIPCLNFALDTDEGHGIWGGTSEAERRKHAVRDGSDSGRSGLRRHTELTRDDPGVGARESRGPERQSSHGTVASWRTSPSRSPAAGNW